MACGESGEHVLRTILIKEAEYLLGSRKDGYKLGDIMLDKSRVWTPLGENLASLRTILPNLRECDRSALCLAACDLTGGADWICGHGCVKPWVMKGAQPFMLATPVANLTLCAVWPSGVHDKDRFNDGVGEFLY